eukprot:g1058.t1
MRRKNRSLLVVAALALGALIAASVAEGERQKMLEPTMEDVLEQRTSGEPQTQEWTRAIDSMNAWSEGSQGQLYAHVKDTCDEEKAGIRAWIEDDRSAQREEEDARDHVSEELRGDISSAKRVLERKISELDDISVTLDTHIDRVNSIFAAAHLVAIEDMISSIAVMRQLSLAMRSGNEEFQDPAFEPIKSAEIRDYPIEDESDPSVVMLEVSSKLQTLKAFMSAGVLRETETALDKLAASIERHQKISESNDAASGFGGLDHSSDEMDESVETDDVDMEDDEEVGVLEKMMAGESPSNCAECLDRQSLGENIACPMCDDEDADVSPEDRVEALFGRLSQLEAEADAVSCEKGDCEEQKADIQRKIEDVEREIRDLTAEITGEEIDEEDEDEKEDMNSDSGTGSVTGGADDHPDDEGLSGPVEGATMPEEEVGIVEGATGLGPTGTFSDDLTIGFLADNIMAGVASWKQMKASFETERQIFETMQMRIQSMMTLKRHRAALMDTTAPVSTDSGISAASSSDAFDRVSSLQSHERLLVHVCDVMNADADEFVEDQATGSVGEVSLDDDVEENLDFATGAEDALDIGEELEPATGVEELDESEELEQATGTEEQLNEYENEEDTAGELFDALNEEEEEEEEEETEPIVGCDGIPPAASLGCEDCDFAFYRPYERNPFTGEIEDDGSDEGEGICTGCLVVENVRIVPPGESNSNFDVLKNVGRATWCPSADEDVSDDDDDDDDDDVSMTGATGLADIDIGGLKSSDFEKMSDDDLIELLSGPASSFLETSEREAGDLLRRLRGRVA